MLFLLGLFITILGLPACLVAGVFCWRANREADLIREGARPAQYPITSRIWAKIRPWRMKGRWQV